jgi:predicted negative regulator of RcsB-dependent stress response
VARITRKELKSDKFALEVGHTVTFFEEHKKEIVRYGAIGLAVAVLVVGYSAYARHQHAARQEALYKAITVQESPVGASSPGALSFPTQDAKDQQALKLFGDVRNNYSGSDEAVVAAYYMGAIHGDQGKLTEAEKEFLEASQKGNAQYAGLAKLSLAQVYFADGRAAQGETALRELIDKPTVFVSKEQATIMLARYLAPTKPTEARKLLEPLMKLPGAVGQVAIGASASLSQQ